MLGRYSNTHKEVQKESFKNVYLISNQHLDEPMCSVFGNTVSLVSRLVHEIAPDLDAMVAQNLPSLAVAKAHYGIGFEHYAIAMFHPVTSEVEQMRQHAQQFFAALHDSGHNYVVIYPNNDLGSRDILANIEPLKHNLRRWCNQRPSGLRHTAGSAWRGRAPMI